MATNENRLIELLPRIEQRRLLSQCELVELPMPSTPGEAAAQPLQHVHFLTAGFVSQLTEVDTHPGLETAMIGREGVLGVELVLGATLAPRMLVHGAGHAWRIAGPDLQRQLGQSPCLRVSVEGYLGVRLAQLAMAAACQRFHRIGPRLARWLLMGQDRMEANCLHVTHELLAQMLGVRRVGITRAAGALQRAGLIEYHRGLLTVQDRVGLERSACSCYAADRQVYQRLME